MKTVLFLGTQQGVIAALQQDYSWVEVSRSLREHHVTSLIANRSMVLVGTTRGVYRAYVPVDLANGNSQDTFLSPLEWEPVQEGIGPRHIRYLAAYPGMDGWVFAGTEPAEVFISYDAGDSWRNCPEVANLRQKNGWSLPYSPAAGCVRGFAFHGTRAYAAVEDGCVLVSDNSGETWRVAEGSSGGPNHSPRAGFVHSDVHSIEVHASSPNLVTAPTGGGLYQSQDGGVSWLNLYRCYTRAAWQNNDNPDHIIFGPADSVDQGGRIEMTRNGGRTWVPASGSLQVPWDSNMVERFIQIDENLLAVLSNGRLIFAPVSSLEWEFILPDIPFTLSAASLKI